MKKMALNHCAQIYGFGTYFLGTNRSRDIDVLILHDANDELACLFAVECKNLLHRNIASLHITILSSSEEREFNFRKKSKAKFIGVVKAFSIDENIGEIVKLISNWPQLDSTSSY